MKRKSADDKEDALSEHSDVEERRKPFEPSTARVRRSCASAGLLPRFHLDQAALKGHVDMQARTREFMDPEVLKKKKPKKEKVKPVKPDKLLILDLNKVLIYRKPYSSNFVVRPHALEFVQRMSKLFVLALWSSAKKDTIKKICNKLFMPNEFCRSRFLFTWSQEKCDIIDAADADAAVNSRAASYYGDAVKPLIRKDLAEVCKVYPEYKNKCLLMDDSSYKAILNCQGSMIVPRPYEPSEEDEEDTDEELKEGSELCLRLERLAATDGDLY
jgi:hypothetical protein